MASRKSKITRSDPVRDTPERNVLRGHALFARYLERRGLGDCLHYFPEDMTIGNLRKASPRELMSRYHITDAKDREKILLAIEEPCPEDHHHEGDNEVGLL